MSSFDPLATFLLVFFVCLWLFNISSICPRDVFDPVKCKARFLFFDCLSLLFSDTNQCFVVFLIVEVFTLSIAMTRAIACIWMFFRLVAFFCLYPSWSIFYPRLKWFSGSRCSPYFATNVVKRNDDSAYWLHFVSPSLKLLYICNEAVWFWELSDLSRKLPSLCWKYCLLPSWDKFKIKF